MAEGGVMVMKTALCILATIALVGCGSSVEPEQPKTELPTTTPPETTPQAVRTIVTRPLLAGSPQNLLLDTTFRDQGGFAWGHFASLYDGGTALATASSRTLSLSPESVSAQVGVFKDTTATDEKSRGIISLSTFLGGKGPFLARIWASRSNVAGAPIALEEDPTVFRAAITTGGLPEGKAYDLVRKSEKTIGDRTWVLFEARIDADLPSTAFFNLKFGRKGGAFMVQAPEVIAISLLPPDVPASFKVGVSPRAVTFDESAAMGWYLRQPHQLSLHKPSTIKAALAD